MLHLADPAEPRWEDALSERCVHFERVELPREVTGRLPRAASKLALLAGRPTRATELRSRTLARRLAELATLWDPDVVQAEYAGLGQYLLGLEGPRPARVVVDHDATLRALRSWGGPLPGLTAALDERAWRRYERRVLDGVDAAVVFTGRDARTLATLGSPTRIVEIGLGVEVAAAADPVAAARPELVFVGNFAHPPNVDAALRLAHGVLAPLRATHPELTLTLVGASPPAAVGALTDDRVVVTGEVPDTLPYLRRATLVVVPLRLGGGMRVKVLEALAAGAAVVATPLAVEGLPVRAGEQVELAESDDELRAAVAALLDDPARRAELGRRGRAWVADRMSWERTVSAYEALYASITG